MGKGNIMLSVFPALMEIVCNKVVKYCDIDACFNHERTG